MDDRFNRLLDIIGGEPVRGVHRFDRSGEVTILHTTQGAAGRVVHYQPAVARVVDPKELYGG